MNKDHTRFLFQDSQYGALIDLCKSGPKRNVKLKVEDLIAGQDLREVCGIIAANRPEIDFGLTLLGLRDAFINAAPAEPAIGDAAAAQSYITACQALAQNLMSNVKLSEAKALAARKCREFATQFSAKTIHSSAKGSAFAPNQSSSLPHLSSRSIRAASIKIALDQKKNDNEGVFQRLVKLMAGDPLVGDSGMPKELIAALEEGIKEGIEMGRSDADSTVDHRLKQILVPSGGGYISLSPLGCAGISVVVGDAAEALYQQWLVFEEARKRVADGAAADGKKKTKKAGKKAARLEEDSFNKEASAAGAPCVEPSGLAVSGLPTVGEEYESILFKPNKLKFEIGGANPRNATIHWTHRGFQSLMHFPTPIRRKATSRAYHFVYRGNWRPRIDQTLIKGFFSQLAAIEASGVLSDSVSIKAIEVQATGALAEIARASHAEAQEFCASLNLEVIEVDGVDEEINEALVRKLRSNTDLISQLDIFLVNGDFGPEYATALAEKITNSLNQSAMRLKDGGYPLSMAERERTIAAIEKVLSAQR